MAAPPNTEVSINAASEYLSFQSSSNVCSYLRRPPLRKPPLLPFLAPREFEEFPPVVVEFAVACLSGNEASVSCAAGSTLVDSGTPARPLLGPRLCRGGRFDAAGAADEGSAVDIMEDELARMAWDRC